MALEWLPHTHFFDAYYSLHPPVLPCGISTITSWSHHDHDPFMVIQCSHFGPFTVASLFPNVPPCDPLMVTLQSTHFPSVIFSRSRHEHSMATPSPPHNPSMVIQMSLHVPMMVTQWSPHGLTNAHKEHCWGQKEEGPADPVFLQHSSITAPKRRPFHHSSSQALHVPKAAPCTHAHLFVPLHLRDKGSLVEEPLQPLMHVVVAQLLKRGCPLPTLVPRVVEARGVHHRNGGDGEVLG